MKIGLIINPAAGSSDRISLLQRVADGRDDVRLYTTSGPGDARTLALKLIDEGIDGIGIGGGDGTINEVVNGIVPYDGSVRLGVIPLGTGNDLARTLSIPDNPEEALRLLETGRVETLDAIRVEGEDVLRYGVNVAAGGFSGQVDEVLDQETKATWGPLAYLFGAADVLPDLQEYTTFIKYEDEAEESVDLLNVVVANGRTAAGGKLVAPMANPQDGWLDVLIVEKCTMVQLAEVAVRLLSGRYQDSPHVHHRRVKRVHIRATPGIWFNVDGELLTKKPLTFSVIPGAIHFVVGEEYRAAPASR